MRYPIIRVFLQHENEAIHNKDYSVVKTSKTERRKSLRLFVFFSLLIIAHTPKRNQSNPISTNDLAGSKKLYNFFDSCFAIGQSARDGGLRYIKQMKNRHGEFVYDAENVIVCQIEKIDAFLQFVEIGTATEREHLKRPTDSDLSQDILAVKELGQKGYSVREIAKKLNMSKSKAHRLLKK